MFRGKNYKESAKLIDKQALYDPKDAFDLVCKASKAKFDETVELHVKLGVDSRHADQQVRGAIVLPERHGQDSARAGVLQAGARGRGQGCRCGLRGRPGSGPEDPERELVRVRHRHRQSPDMMGVVGRLGKLLGPKGLMPSPKAGTVTPNITQAIHGGQGR